MIKKNTEEINDVLFSLTMFASMFTLMLISIFFVGFMVYGLTHQKFKTVYLCSYCGETITENADYVCMTDGRRAHAECYMRAIREDYNGETNSKAP